MIEASPQDTFIYIYISVKFFSKPVPHPKGSRVFFCSSQGWLNLNPNDPWLIKMGGYKNKMRMYNNFEWFRPKKTSCIARVWSISCRDPFFLGEGDCLSCRVPDHLFARPYFGGYRNKMTGAMWGCLVEIGVIITHIDILINIPYPPGELTYPLPRYFEEFWRFPNLGFVSSLEGIHYIQTTEVWYDWTGAYQQTPATHLALSIPSGCLGIDHTGYIVVGDVTRLCRKRAN